MLKSSMTHTGITKPYFNVNSCTTQLKQNGCSLETNILLFPMIIPIDNIITCLGKVKSSKNKSKIVGS